MNIIRELKETIGMLLFIYVVISLPLMILMVVTSLIWPYLSYVPEQYGKYLLYWSVSVLASFLVAPILILTSTNDPEVIEAVGGMYVNKFEGKI